MTQHTFSLMIEKEDLKRFKMHCVNHEISMGKKVVELMKKCVEDKQNEELIHELDMGARDL